MLRVFTGHDPREEVGTWVFCSSVLRRTTRPVSFTPLHKPVLDAAFGERFSEGTNAFTMSRFLVPALCDFVSAGQDGVVLFCDGADMLCRADLSGLAALYDPRYAVQVVKHDYRTRHPIKYVGTSMEAANRDYERKNWASLMLFNPAHAAWRGMTPGRVSEMSMGDLLQFRFLDDRSIGELPIEWNWLADEYGENNNAKLLHWTAGVPGFPHYRDAAHSHEWFVARNDMNWCVS